MGCHSTFITTFIDLLEVATIKLYDLILSLKNFKIFFVYLCLNHLSRLIDAKTLLRWNIKIICELNYVPNRYIMLSIFFKYSLSWLFLRKIIISLNSRRDKTINSGIIKWQWGKLFICLLQCITCDISVQTAFPHALSMEHVTILACRSHPCQSLWSTSESEGLKLQ